MPFYFMYADSGPGHQSHSEKYFFSEYTLSDDELHERWDDWTNERYLRDPKGSAWILTEIKPAAHELLTESYEREIQRATLALNALKLIPLEQEK